MSFSAVELCAQALVRLGAAPITSFAEPTLEAKVAARLYPLTRDALLASHPWSFTLREVELLPLAEPSPPGSGGKLFALPADCLRVVSAGPRGRGRGLEYRIQGQRLVAGVDQLVLTYQAAPAETDLPAWFAQALVARLAAELCLPITENAQRAEALAKIAERETRQARLIDSQQATPNRIEDFSLIEARFA
jgi:hypothetical protein